MSKRTLPPDPDKLNSARARWADAAIKAFPENGSFNPETTLCYLLSDIGHWCDRHRINFNRVLETAAKQYQDETAGKGTQL